jgi:hypothetical protein
VAEPSTTENLRNEISEKNVPERIIALGFSLATAGYLIALFYFFIYFNQYAFGLSMTLWIGSRLISMKSQRHNETYKLIFLIFTIVCIVLIAGYFIIGFGASLGALGEEG